MIFIGMQSPGCAGPSDDLVLSAPIGLPERPVPVPLPGHVEPTLLLCGRGACFLLRRTPRGVLTKAAAVTGRCVGAHAQCTSRHTPRFPRSPPAILRLCSSSSSSSNRAWIKRAEIYRQTHHAATHSCNAFVPSWANLLHRRVTKTFCALWSWPSCGVLRKSVIYTLKKLISSIEVT